MTSTVDQRHKVLVTGSTGAVGQPVCRALLARGHQVRGFARRPTPGLDDYHTGNLTDADAVAAAVAGVDTIIHLGAYPNSADFLDVLLEPNVIGLWNVLEAARMHEVRRLVLASTVQVYNGCQRQPDRALPADIEPKPTNAYAMTKVWAEIAGEMFARCQKRSVISVRIGWLPRSHDETRRIGTASVGPRIYLSHHDAGRFFVRCVESPMPKAGQSVILFASSKPTGPADVELDSARRVIGYEPIDRFPDGLDPPFEAGDENST